MPYSLLLCGEHEERYASDELAVFRHIVEHEVHLYEQRGFFYGPLTLISLEHGRIDGNVFRKGFARLPSFVERDLVTIECDARGVLLVESQRAFEVLARCRQMRDLRFIVATGCGVPRYAMRRLLHRLSTESSLPVYVLADNDTWGYFLYSVVVRGALSPKKRCDGLAVDDARFAGIHAGTELVRRHCGSARRKWKPHWDLRIRHMCAYECFKKSVTWKQEFRAFRRQGCAYDLLAVIETLGPDKFVVDYLAKQL